MSSSERAVYLKNVLFPRAAADGAFEPGAEYVSFLVDDDGPTVIDQFASDILFGTVTLRTGDRLRRLAVVVKFKNADPVATAAMNMHQKFHNEHTFYARLLPELARRAADPDAALALFPRFIYSNVTRDGVHRDGDGEQVIVISNATTDGYRLSEQRVFLDDEHVLLALRKLGTLHGLSYAAKEHRDGRDTFVELTASLAETQWFNGHWYKSPRFLMGKYP